jgi:hypothetical protein
MDDILRCQLIELMKYEIRMECFVHIEICVGSGFTTTLLVRFHQTASCGGTAGTYLVFVGWAVSSEGRGGAKELIGKRTR